MRRLLVALMLPGLVLAAPAAEPSAQRQAELLHLLRQDCGSCHGLFLKGGLGPPLLPAALAPLSDEMLTKTILHGRPGTPMPPWAFEITPAEADWLVRRLRDGISHVP
jgi:cytochrome c55X